MAVIKSEFFLALNQVATERGISPDDVLDSIKAAVLAAYKKDFVPESQEARTELIGGEEPEEEEQYRVEVNQESGEMHIFEEDKDITPPGFGRIAAQTARQVILQQIREAEKRTIVQLFTGKVGTIIKGRVIRFDGRNVLLDINKAEGTLPPEEQIRSERYHLNDSITVYIKEIREDAYGNSHIILSRAHPDLVRELFTKEVPEIESGTVEIKGVVREPGERTKIAVYSSQSGVDPVGACVGQKGIRVKAVTDELGGAEKIDIIQFNEDISSYIREALSPAAVENIEVNEEEKHAKVTVDEEQAPLAIGRNGVNVNLASRLTEFEIDIEQIEGEGSPSDKDDAEDDSEKPDETPVSSDEADETEETEASEDTPEAEVSEEKKTDGDEVEEETPKEDDSAENDDSSKTES